MNNNALQNANTQTYCHLFKTLPAAEQPWLQEKRQHGIDCFIKNGFPGTKNENWKYTPITALTDQNFSYQPDNALKPRWTIPANLPKEAVITDLLSACKQFPELVQRYLEQSFECSENGFLALNTALFQQGIFIYLPSQIQCAEPLWIEYPAADGQMIHWRNLIILEEGAEMTIVESFDNAIPSTYWNHGITEIYLHKNTKLTHCKWQNEGKHAFHLGKTFVDQKCNSHFESCVLSIGSAWARSDIQVSLTEESAQCVLNGLSFGQNRQYLDHHTEVEHLKPSGKSEEYYKSILSDNARGVFNGKVIVSPNAHQTDAAQQNKTLLLSKTAQMNTKPQLEIFADDVKCSHGATVGQLSEEALFYLRTRGIEFPHAQQLLISAFAQDILDKIPIDLLKEKAQEKMGSS